jgi:HAD superfamily hydrolase (TIGR01509 family)
MFPPDEALPAIIPFPDRSTGLRRISAAALRRPVAGLLLDTGGVLYDETTWRRWLMRLFGQLGICVKYQGFFQQWDREFQGAVHRGECSFCDAFRSFLRAVGFTPAQTDEVEAACRAQRRKLDAELRALPGVRSTLARLSQSGYVLATLSNSEHTAGVLRERLANLGLESVFAAVVSSFDLGCAKPDRRSYLAALESMKLPAPQVAFLGHDTAELAGAAAVGMATIAFNFDPDARADVFIARFEELADVLRRRAHAAAG